MPRYRLGGYLIVTLLLAGTTVQAQGVFEDDDPSIEHQLGQEEWELGLSLTGGQIELKEKKGKPEEEIKKLLGSHTLSFP